MSGFARRGDARGADDCRKLWYHPGVDRPLLLESGLCCGRWRSRTVAVPGMEGKISLPKAPFEPNDSEPAPAGEDAARGGGANLGRLGDFDLRREIGRGGMGTVFEAWQISLNRLVALKVLGHHISSSSAAIQRFQREAQAAAKLHHTHITPIFAQGSEHGVYYYAMELVDGPSLHAMICAALEKSDRKSTLVDVDETVVLSRGATAGACQPRERSSSTGDTTVLLLPDTPPPGTREHYVTAARHIASVADALEYAHSHGVVHRDIKPHNLLLGSDGRMRITDFGLARISEMPGVTMTGELIGSPLYMSPEQISEDRSQIDHRTDIYSLGATLYEWLTLRPPYPGETRERVISLIMHSEATAPRAIDPAIPIALETICMKALERDRRRRYQSAAELRDDLRRFLDSQPIRARRAGIAARAVKLVLRHQLASILLAAAVVALVLSAALLTKQGEIKTKEAHLQEVVAAAQAAKDESNQLLDAFSTLLGSGLPLEVGGPVRMAEAALPMVGRLFAGAPSGRDSGGAGAPEVAAVPTGTPEGIAQRAIQDFYNAVSLIDDEGIKDQPAMPEPLLEAYDLRDKDARAALDRVDDYLRDNGDDYRALELHAALAARLGEFATMAADADTLIRLRRDHPIPYVWRGLARLFQKDFARSLQDFNTAARFEEMSPWSRAFRALVLLQHSLPADAIAELDQALSEAPNLAIGLLARSIAYGAISDYRNALSDVTRVVDMEPANADALTVRGQYHAVLGNYAAAVDDFDRAMSLAGRSQALLVKWTLARLAMRQSETTERGASSVVEPADDDVAPDASRVAPAASPETPVPAGSTMPADKVQEWFSRHVWPRTPNDTRDDANAPPWPVPLPAPEAAPPKRPPSAPPAP